MKQFHKRALSRKKQKHHCAFAVKLVKYRLIDYGTLTINNGNDLLLVHHIHIQNAFENLNLYFNENNVIR